MTDNETRPQCRAQLLLGTPRSPYRCVLPENHPGPHEDDDGDRWDIEYVDPEPKPFVLKTRPVQEQLTALTVRVGLLEAALTPAQPPENEAVLIDPVELGELLEAREKLTAMWSPGWAAGTAPTACDWASPTGAFCSLPAGHTVNHITPYPPDHVCGPSCD